MFATARILLSGGEDAIFVPRNTVVRDKTTDSNQVYIVQDGQARLRVVLTGDLDGDSIRILSGLLGNEAVATNSQGALYDGAPVEVKPQGGS
jgi:multidrug efflux pump subunit AcrA (membrane-fusion protein)